MAVRLFILDWLLLCSIRADIIKILLKSEQMLKKWSKKWLNFLINHVKPITCPITPNNLLSTTNNLYSLRTTKITLISHQQVATKSPSTTRHSVRCLVHLASTLGKKCNKKWERMSVAKTISVESDSLILHLFTADTPLSKIFYLRYFWK